MQKKQTKQGRNSAFWAVFATLLLFMSSSACGILDLGDDPQKEPKADDISVLFIGSSYLAFNDVPQRFEEFSRRAGYRVFVTSHTYLGQPLAFFASESSAAYVIRQRKWDFVVLQGGAHRVAYPSGSEYPVYPALKELHRKATEDSPDTKVVWMMPWAYEDGMQWVEGRTETYEDMQHDIRENALEWSDDLGLIVAPVGMAFYKVLTEWNQGPHFLHDSDWNHASKAGSYLAAATFFSTIFSESCSGVEYNWKLEKGLAQDLRDVASSTVLDDLELWNITP